MNRRPLVAILGLGLISLSIITVPRLANAADAPATPADCKTSAPLSFNPEIPLPNFLGGDVDANTLANYIRAVFIYFIWTVGILAVVMVTYGGVRWVAAAGNAGRINDARETVNNALIGLILALTSYVLLYTINHELVKLPNLNPQCVQKELLETDGVVGEGGEGTNGQACTTKRGTPIKIELDCAAGTQMSWPVSQTTSQKITSRVGPRDVQVGSSCHPGTDFSTDKVTGKPVIAMVTGTISKIVPLCGESSITLEAGAFHIRYVHVKSVNVAVGQSVQKGSVIGLSGGDPNTSPAVKACSGGAHVHVELYTSNGDLHDIAPCVQEQFNNIPAGGRSQE